MTDPVLLAMQVCLVIQGRNPNVCQAFINSHCGKPGTDWLCPRHRQVALKRLEKEGAKRAALEARKAAWRARNEKTHLARLAEINTALERIGNHTPQARGDNGYIVHENQVRRYADLLRERSSVLWDLRKYGVEVPEP